MSKSLTARVLQTLTESGEWMSTGELAVALSESGNDVGKTLTSLLARKKIERRVEGSRYEHRIVGADAAAKPEAPARKSKAKRSTKPVNVPALQARVEATDAEADTTAEVDRVTSRSKVSGKPQGATVLASVVDRFIGGGLDRGGLDTGLPHRAQKTLDVVSDLAEYAAFRDANGVTIKELLKAQAAMRRAVATLTAGSPP